MTLNFVFSCRYFHIALSEAEQDILKGAITRASDNLINLHSKVVPRVKFYKSVYATLFDESYEAGWLLRLHQMAEHRPSNVSPIRSTSWGVSGVHLAKLTEFENAFASMSFPPLSNGKQDQDPSIQSSALLGTPTHRITFISPLDGKEAICRATQLITKAVKSGSLKEEDVDQAILHNMLSSPDGELWPSPDLIMNFTDVPANLGYPAWHLRYAEIVNVGRLGSGMPTIWSQFYGALRSFSKTVQRYGK